MSVQYNTYLGPFVLVHNPPIAGFDEYHGCDNQKCPKALNRSSLKFCPECGNKIKLVKVPDSKPMEFDQYSELDDRLVEVMDRRPKEYEDYITLIPNVKFGPKRRMHVDNEDGCNVQIIGTGGIFIEFDEFNSAFKKELNYLSKRFGEKAVNVHWGMVNYYS